MKNRSVAAEHDAKVGDTVVGLVGVDQLPPVALGGGTGHRDRTVHAFGVLEWRRGWRSAGSHVRHLRRVQPRCQPLDPRGRTHPLPDPVQSAQLDEGLEVALGARQAGRSDAVEKAETEFLAKSATVTTASRRSSGLRTTPPLPDPLAAEFELGLDHGQDDSDSSAITLT